MSLESEVERKNRQNDFTAIESVAGDMASHFLRENKKKGRPLQIPSLGIQLNANGTVEKLRSSEQKQGC